MTSRVAIALCLTLAACAGTEPDAGVRTGSGGTSANVGVEAPRGRAGMSTGGPYARADVVRTPNANLSLGTGGAAARVGAGPLSVGVGSRGWWGLGWSL